MKNPQRATAYRTAANVLREDREPLRNDILAALLSVRVPVDDRFAALYARSDGTMPLYDRDEPEVQALADAVTARLRGEDLT